MIRALAFALIALAAACTYMPGKPGAYTDTDVFALHFLKGRWTGTGPDGKPFYEKYDFPDAMVLRSQRYDSGFKTPGDESRVFVRNGDIISQWGEYTWKATEARDGYIAFAPVNAPSSFSWRKVDADTVEVLQKWTGEDGKPQSYTVTLKRVG
jgi:hypothetical protein